MADKKTPREDAALAEVAPALKTAYLDGHDSGYAAANVADPWAKTDPNVEQLLANHRAWTKQAHEEADQARAELDALKEELRPRLNGLLGALCGQGNSLVAEMRRAIAVLDAAGGQPVTEATTEQAAEFKETVSTLNSAADNSRLLDIPTTPSEPRVWAAGSAEPADVRKVRDMHGDVWTKSHGGAWESPETMPCAWPYIAKKWAPLVEVVDVVETALRPVYADPGDVDYEYDEDETPVDPTVRWPIAWGCTVSIGQYDGALRFTVSISDDVQRDGIAVRSVTRQQIRAYAHHLIELTEVVQDAPGGES